MTAHDLVEDVGCNDLNSEMDPFIHLLEVHDSNE